MTKINDEKIEFEDAVDGINNPGMGAVMPGGALPTITIKSREFDSSGEKIREKILAVTGNTTHETFVYLMFSKFCDEAKTPKEFAKIYSGLLDVFGRAK